MPSLIKNPGGFAEENPALQFLPDNQSDIALPLDDLHFVREYVKDLPVTVMRPINDDHLESLVHSDSASWPPISVTLTNRGWICFDGQHRIKAATLLKLGTIRARSTAFKDMNALIEATFRANLKHGLRASQTTRSDYCYWLSLTFPKLSQRDIAARVGVAQSTVARAIEQRQKQQEKPSQAEATTPEKEEEDAKQKQAQNFTKSTGRFLKVASGFLKTVPIEDYEELVWNLQVELLNSPEDKEMLQRAGKFLLDVAKARRRKKVAA